MRNNFRYAWILTTRLMVIKIEETVKRLLHSLTFRRLFLLFSLTLTLSPSHIGPCIIWAEHLNHCSRLKLGCMILRLEKAFILSFTEPWLKHSAHGYKERLFCCQKGS